MKRQCSADLPGRRPRPCAAGQQRPPPSITLSSFAAAHGARSTPGNIHTWLNAGCMSQAVARLHSMFMVIVSSYNGLQLQNREQPWLLTLWHDGQRVWMWSVLFC